VLFGSSARGEPGAADLDLGVLGPASLDVIDASVRFMHVLHTGVVDVVDLRHANPVLLMSVARDGIPLFDASGTQFAEFSSLAMRRYADTKKFRDAVRDDLREYAGRQPDRNRT
jgi:hypothetical protein